ncbi:MAG TPA: recombinase RecT, partial [Gammaproteobacteria bacterium]|nr:recombinase RecT [Gammaproteobacteria bacterium]
MTTNTNVATLPQAHSFPAMLKQYQTEIARALPRHLNPDRMTRIALTEFRKNPKLAECDPRSVFAAVIMASQLGLEPGLMGQCYLIPYKSECQLIPGYQGLLDLVRRSGKVKRIEAQVVYERDHFTYRTGLTVTLDHEPLLDGDRGEPRLAYAVAEFTDGGHHVEIMTRAQIEAIRDRGSNSQNAKR